MKYRYVEMDIDKLNHSSIRKHFRFHLVNIIFHQFRNFLHRSDRFSVEGVCNSNVAYWTFGWTYDLRFDIHADTHKRMQPIL